MIWLLPSLQLSQPLDNKSVKELVSEQGKTVEDLMTLLSLTITSAYTSSLILNSDMELCDEADKSAESNVINDDLSTID